MACGCAHCYEQVQGCASGSISRYTLTQDRATLHDAWRRKAAEEELFEPLAISPCVSLLILPRSSVSLCLHGAWGSACLGFPFPSD